MSVPISSVIRIFRTEQRRSGSIRLRLQFPATYTYGNSGRNTLRGPAFWNLDASLFRKFPFTETKSLEFRAEAFNMPNTVILSQPGSDISNAPTFGVITSTQNSSRIIQFGAKLVF